MRTIRGFVEDESGAATAEYVVATMAAVGFAGLLVVILRSGEVRAILTDHEKNLWIGTASGLSVLRTDGTLHTYSADDGLPASFIMALQEDEQHRIWVGTGVGVSVFSNGKFEPINIAAMENAEYAFGFYSEPGYMWMTTDRGLLRYRSSDGAIGMVGRAKTASGTGQGTDSPAGTVAAG